MTRIHLLLFVAALRLASASQQQLHNLLDDIYSLHFASLDCLVVVDSNAEFTWLPPSPKPPVVPAPIFSVRLGPKDTLALSQGPLSPDAAAAILSEDEAEEWVPLPPSSSTPALRVLLSARKASCDAYVIFLSTAADPGFSLIKDGPRSGLLHGTARVLLVLGSGNSTALTKVLPPTYSATRVAMVQEMDGGRGYTAKRRLPKGDWVRWTSGEVLFGSRRVPDDLGGRTLVMSTFPYEPFSFVKHGAERESPPGKVDCGKENEDHLSSLEGTEVRIVRELANKLNFRPCAILRPTSRWLNHSPNGSLQGVLADVSNLVADLGFAGFYQDAREAQMVDYSAPYTYAAVSFLVPRPRSPSVPRWMALVLPFSAYSWAAIGGALAAAALTLYLLASIAASLLPPPIPVAYARYVRLPDCMLHVASVVAQVGVPVCEGRWPLQWFLPGLNLITYCYSGCLVAYLTLPSLEAPINTLAELRASGLPWGARTSYWSLLLLHNWENQDAQVLGRRFRLIPDPMVLRQGLLSAEMAVAVQTVQGSYVANAEYLDARAFSQVHLMQEVAYEGYVSLLLPKGSPLSRPADAVINRLMAAGLVQRWERGLTSSSSSPSSDSSTPASPSSPSARGPVVLSLEHLLGAFLLLLIGLLAATTAFLFEVFAAKRRFK